MNYSNSTFGKFVGVQLFNVKRYHLNDNCKWTNINVIDMDRVKKGSFLILCKKKDIITIWDNFSEKFESSGFVILLHPKVNKKKENKTIWTEITTDHVKKTKPNTLLSESVYHYGSKGYYYYYGNKGAYGTKNYSSVEQYASKAMRSSLHDHGYWVTKSCLDKAITTLSSTCMNLPSLFSPSILSYLQKQGDVGVLNLNKVSSKRYFSMNIWCSHPVLARFQEDPTSQHQEIRSTSMGYVDSTSVFFMCHQDHSWPD